MVSFMFVIQFDRESGFSVWIRTYFNFLDSIFGQGLFIIFLAMFLCETKSNGMILYAIVATVIGIVDLVLGFNDLKRGLPSLPWEDSSKDKAQSKRAEAYKPNDVELSASQAPQLPSMALEGMITSGVNEANKRMQAVVQPPVQE
mmetsp:Transcript_6815/g.11494  ORF Transcript_6815/g.11494 Transcript_6815/m.11494 type:complete len:145 (-) Transcript_6815:244-678(-)